MIKIENLTKVYKAKAKTECRALDGISTVLPDCGLVFILGKSGSGKSTLLNLIGGLDSFDSGDIVSFGNSLSSFGERDFEAYRSDFVSFIFQDYHLIDELTVYENITLFGSDEIDTELLSRTLETVEMAEYVDRYPSELSGGQKQRVAIARGIMKDPRVILCDEPTGNLDRKTSVQILELLKKLSREKLVIIVSHNLTEAERYADRIIELSDGHIIDDRARTVDYSDSFVMEGERATLPYHTRMLDSEVERLNSAIRSGEITEIRMNGSGFEPTEIEYAEDKKTLRLKKLGRQNTFKLFKKFFFTKYRSAITTVILSVLMFGLFSVIQSFISFDSKAALYDSLDEECPMISVEREYSTFPYNIYDDLSVYSNGKTYYMYSQTLWTDNDRYSSWDNNKRSSDRENLNELYSREGYGLLLCDDEYLIDLYGRDGDIPLLIGDLDGARKTGVLITDYFADSIIYFEAKSSTQKYVSYESLIGKFVPCGKNSAGVISGIIDTGYKEKYKDVFDTYKRLIEDEEIADEDLVKLIGEDPLYVVFADDIISNLAVAYSLNPNYIDDFDLSEFSIVRCFGMYFATEDKELTSPLVRTLSTIDHQLVNRALEDGEAGIPYSVYNTLFGTDYSDSDVNKFDHVPKKTVKVRRYVDDDPNAELLYEKEFTVSFVTSNRFVVSENMMYFFKRADWRPSRVYYKGDVDLEGLTSFMTEGEYKFVARRQRNIQRISEIIGTFRDLFVLLEVTIVSVIGFYLIYFGMRSIKQNSYQIGVIKALGGRGIDVGRIFVLKTFIIGVVIALTSSIASIGFIAMANEVLIGSIESVVGMKIVYVDVISYSPLLIGFDALLVILIAFISALVPTVMLKRIKPVDIIRAKE